MAEKVLLCEQEHRNLAREAVRKSLVLLKNGKGADDPLLPLPKYVPRILVAGSHADNLGYQCGGWTINWQGFSGNKNTAGMLFFPSGLLLKSESLCMTWVLRTGFRMSAY